MNKAPETSLVFVHPSFHGGYTWLAKLCPAWLGVDKIFHFGGFFFLALFIYPSLARWQFLRMGFFCLLAFAMATELMQLNLPHRTASVGDWLANVAGIISAWMIICPLCTLKRNWGQYKLFVGVHWLKHQHSAVCEDEIVCPNCCGHHWYRLHRLLWMRFFPSSISLQCSDCYTAYLFSRNQFIQIIKTAR